MSQTDTIKEYVVGLGYEVDETSEANFKAGLLNAGLIVASFGAVVYAAASKVRDFVASEAKGLHDLSSFSNLVKENAAEVEAWSYAADIMGSSAGAAQGSIRGLTQMLGSASLLPGGRAAKMFDKLGLSIKGASGRVKTAFELIDDLREKLKTLERPEQLGLLSRLGIDPTLLRTITEDWSGLRAELASVNRELGMSKQEAADLGATYTDSAKKLETVVSVLRQAIAVRLMPELIRRLEDARRWVVAHAGDIVSWATWAMQKVLDVANMGFQLARDMIDAIRYAITFVRVLNDETGGWLFTMGKLYLAWKLWNSELASSPTGQILKMAAAISLLWNDYKVFKAGGTSAIDWDSWFGKGIILIGELAAGWEFLKLAILPVIWNIAKFFAFFWLGNKVTGWLVDVTKGFRLLNLAARGLRIFFLLDDWLLGILVLFPLVLYGLYKIADWFDLFGDWTPALDGWAAFFAYIRAGWSDSWKNSMEGWSKFGAWLGVKFDEMGDTIAAWASTGAQDVIDAWESVKKWFADWIDWLGDHLPTMQGLTSWLPGGIDATAAPSPAAAAQLRSGGVTQNNGDVEINMYGSSDPAAGGRAVGRELTSVYALQQRNLANATTP